MTINITELRRLAQAATPGPDGVSLSWIKLLQDFQQGANPAAINELLDRLEAAEKAVTEAYQRGYATGQEEIEKERDALRALVVMRFDHDYPPQFTQGHDLHELTDPVTAEHCRWFVAEIERLRTDCDALRAKVEAMERQEPYAFAVTFPESSRVELVHDLDEAYEDMTYEVYEVRKLYLAPGAQPAPTIAEQDQINAEAAIRSIYGARPNDEALWQTIVNGMITPAHTAQAVADGTITPAHIMQLAPSIPEGWKLVPTAESRHPGIHKMLNALHAVDNTPGASEWESYAAFLAATPEAKP